MLLTVINVRWWEQHVFSIVFEKRLRERGRQKSSALLCKSRKRLEFFRHYTEPANASHSPVAEAAGRRIQRFRKGLPLSTMPYLVTRMNPGHGHLLSAAVTSKKRPHHRLLWYSATKGSAQSTETDPRRTSPGKERTCWGVLRVYRGVGRRSEP